MSSNSFSKKLCMNQFSIRLSTIAQTTFFDLQKNERLTAAFIYVVEGGACLRTDTATLTIESGSLLYVPEHTVYTLQWHSDQKIRYYTIFATARDYDTAMMKDDFPLQLVRELSTPETGATFAALYELMKSGERIAKIRAVSLYYDFYASALQYLQSATERVYHPALLQAITLLSERYAENDPFSDIARECCISETRLYHLFREQIGVSPVAFRNEKRIQRAAELLQSDLSVEEIAERTGFNSVPYFYETFKKRTGLTPNEYKKIAR